MYKSLRNTTQDLKFPRNYLTITFIQNFISISIIVLTLNQTFHLKKSTPDTHFIVMLNKRESL